MRLASDSLKKITFFLLLISVSVVFYGCGQGGVQSGGMSGYVKFRQPSAEKNPESNLSPVANCRIIMRTQKDATGGPSDGFNKEVVVYTNNQGYYSLGDIPGGYIQVELYKEGFKEYSENIFVQDGVSKIKDFYLDLQYNNPENKGNVQLTLVDAFNPSGKQLNGTNPQISMTYSDGSTKTTIYGTYSEGNSTVQMEPTAGSNTLLITATGYEDFSKEINVPSKYDVFEFKYTAALTPETGAINGKVYLKPDSLVYAGIVSVSNVKVSIYSTTAGVSFNSITPADDGAWVQTNVPVGPNDEWYYNATLTTPIIASFNQPNLFKPGLSSANQVIAAAVSETAATITVPITNVSVLVTIVENSGTGPNKPSYVTCWLQMKDVKFKEQTKSSAGSGSSVSFDFDEIPKGSNITIYGGAKASTTLGSAEWKINGDTGILWDGNTNIIVYLEPSS